MRCPFAIWTPGPLEKINRSSSGILFRQGKGAVLHSAEGSLGGALGRLRDLNAEVSWQFTNDLDGTLYQHYDIEFQCWHARAFGNVRWVGIEHPNLYSNGHPDHRPFTSEQLDTDARLLQWLSEVEGWDGFQPHAQLWEHNWIQGNSTSCPSGRIPWDELLTRLNPPAPPIIIVDGIGVHYTDGSSGPIWSPPEDGRILDGIGLHKSDGSQEQIWPVPVQGFALRNFFPLG